MANQAEDNGKGDAAKSEAATPASAAGGFKAWLPLLVTVIAMPLLAYATTSYVLIPKIKKAIGQPAQTKSTPAESEASGSEHGTQGGPGEAPAAASGGKSNYPFGKVLVNLSGSMGTRYLLANFSVVSSNPNLKQKIEANKDQLLDLASSTLGGKTIADLEKPGARNMIRTELISAFNTALGGPVVQEIYFTEFAIQ